MFKNKVFFIYLACVFSSCAVMKDRIKDIMNLYPDNPVEEWVEERIEDATGLDVDLTSEDK